jgi:hypothetical protein
MKKILFVLLTLTAIVVLGALLLPRGTSPPVPVVNLPWQIEALADGNSRVYGLTLTRSTLGDARRLHGEDMDVALIASGQESGTLEAYYVNFTAGVLPGKLILLADADAATLAHLRDHAAKVERIDADTRKFLLRHEDLERAYAIPITAITFIPAASFDQDTAIKRFGTPTERIRTDAQVEHLLYPALGLDITLDARGKEVLQYVAPRQFARLRDPLVEWAAKKSAHDPSLMSR